MPDNPSSAFYAKLSTVLASIVSLGFLAWSGVIWTRSDDLMKANTQILRGQERLELKLDHISATLTEHKARPWHDEAGAAHAATRRELDAMRQRMDYHHNGTGP